MSNRDSGLFEEGSAIAFPLEEGLTLDPESESESESKSIGEKSTGEIKLIINPITNPIVNLAITFFRNNHQIEIKPANNNLVFLIKFLFIFFWIITR